MTLSSRTLLAGVLAAGILHSPAHAGAAPIGPNAALAAPGQPITTVQYWGPGPRPGWGHRPYYGHRPHYGPPRGYYGPPRAHYGPRCSVVRRWDPHWGGWRTVRRCW
jgi:hypothetical protein